MGGGIEQVNFFFYNESNLIFFVGGGWGAKGGG